MSISNLPAVEAAIARFVQARAEWRWQRHMKAVAALRRSREQYGMPQSGFSLIELLIVVAIIAILALIAIPAYSNYATAAQVSEGLRMADATETAVAASLQSAGVLPGTNAAAGVSAAAGKYVGDISINQGSVTVTYSATAPASIAGKTITLHPYFTSDGASLGWVCAFASSTVPAGWTIPSTDGTGTAAPADTVPVQFLPKSCRAGG